MHLCHVKQTENLPPAVLCEDAILSFSFCLYCISDILSEPTVAPGTDVFGPVEGPAGGGFGTEVNLPKKKFGCC